MKFINLGSMPNAGDASTLIEAMNIINENFAELNYNFNFDIISPNDTISSGFEKINKNFLKIKQRLDRIEKLKKINSL